MNLDFLRRPFVVLLTVPAGIAFLVALASLLMVYLERFLPTSLDYSFLQQLPPDTARNVLSLIAAGAMSALTLTYSIVLVVFTLAAGNLAPRMLKRFTSDLVNQMTAGIFGGTFLYALLTASFVTADFVPDIAILGAEVLAVLCVMQLIYFVRHVSKSVTIDDEIAGITEKLKTALLERDKAADSNGKDAEKEVEALDKFVFDIEAGHPGYLGSLNENRLVSIARKQETALRVQKPKGAYTLSDEVLVKATKELDEGTVKDIQEHISIQPSRSEDSPVEFSINLLVEIALRALSPGTNDTFTAIATVDSLSNALSRATSVENRSAMIRTDEEGTIRLLVPELSMENLINQAFHPLRQASGDNILMAICLARAYARLWVTCSPDIRDLLKDHGLLLIREIERVGHLPEDIENVVGYLPAAIRKANRKRVAEQKE